MRLQTGDEMRLRLSTDFWNWTDVRFKGSAIWYERVRYIRDPGFKEWNVRAVRAGTAVISARGEPDCGSTCARKPRNIRVMIKIIP